MSEPIGWFTMNHRHVPIMLGQTKASTRKAFLDKQQSGKSSDKEMVDKVKSVKKKYAEIKSDSLNKAAMLDFDDPRIKTLANERDEKLTNLIKSEFNVSKSEDIQKYTDILERCTNFRSNMPAKASIEISKWEIVNQSPYSQSFYNSKDISWGSKPERKHTNKRPLEFYK